MPNDSLRKKDSVSRLRVGRNIIVLLIFIQLVATSIGHYPDHQASLFVLVSM